MFPVKLGLIWPRSFREKIFLTLANQKQELLLAAIFVGQMELTKKLYRGPYIDDSCQVWLHLAKQFQRRRFF